MNPTILTSQTKWAFLASFIITAVFTFLQTVLHIQIEEAIIHWVVWFVDGLFALLGVFGVRNAIAKAHNDFYQSSASIPKDSDGFEIKGGINGATGNIVKTILLILGITFMLSGLVVITGCSGAPICYDCSKGPLSWQGSITGLTGGRYIETTCFKIDTWKIIQQISAGELSWTDLLKEIKVEVVIKNGEFCDPNDKSYYKVTLQSDDADKDKKVIYTKSDAIIPKEPSDSK